MWSSLLSSNLSSNRASPFLTSQASQCSPMSVAHLSRYYLEDERTRWSEEEEVLEGRIGVRFLSFVVVSRSFSWTPSHSPPNILCAIAKCIPLYVSVLLCIVCEMQQEQKVAGTKPRMWGEPTLLLCIPSQENEVCSSIMSCCSSM